MKYGRREKLCETVFYIIGFTFCVITGETDECDFIAVEQ